MLVTEQQASEQADIANLFSLVKLEGNGTDARLDQSSVSPISLTSPSIPSSETKQSHLSVTSATSMAARSSEKAKTRSEHLLEDAAHRFVPAYLDVETAQDFDDMLGEVVRGPTVKAALAHYRRIVNPTTSASSQPELKGKADKCTLAEEAVSGIGEAIRVQLLALDSDPSHGWDDTYFVAQGHQIVHVSTRTAFRVCAHTPAGQTSTSEGATNHDKPDIACVRKKSSVRVQVLPDPSQAESRRSGRLAAVQTTPEAVPHDRSYVNDWSPIQSVIEVKVYGSADLSKEVYQGFLRSTVCA